MGQRLPIEKMLQVVTYRVRRPVIMMKIFHFKEKIIGS